MFVLSGSVVTVEQVSLELLKAISENLMMAGSVRVWYFAEELISHKKVIPASAKTQTI